MHTHTHNRKFSALIWQLLITDSSMIYQTALAFGSEEVLRNGGGGEPFV
jgi:hypothetical protein